MTIFYVKTYVSEYPEDKGKVLAYIGSQDHVNPDLKEQVEFTVELPYRNIATIPTHFFPALGELAFKERAAKHRAALHSAEIRTAYEKAYRWHRVYLSAIGKAELNHRKLRAERELRNIRVAYPALVDSAGEAAASRDFVDPLCVPARGSLTWDRDHKLRPSSRLTGKILGA